MKKTAKIYINTIDQWLTKFLVWISFFNIWAFKIWSQVDIRSLILHTQPYTYCRYFMCSMVVKWECHFPKIIKIPPFYIFLCILLFFWLVLSFFKKNCTLAFMYWNKPRHFNIIKRAFHFLGIRRDNKFLGDISYALYGHGIWCLIRTDWYDSKIIYL